MGGPPVNPFDNSVWDRPPTYARSAFTARLVAVMDFQRSDRGLCLIRQRTRCLHRFDVHELMMTDEAGAAPGGIVQAVAYLGFAEFLLGGVIAEGDKVYAGDRYIGAVSGFDETHMPNHLNLVLKSAVLASGYELGLALGDQIEVRPPSTAGP